jgi:hypothetical protein
MGSGVDRADLKPDPRGKVRVGIAVSLDAGQYDDPGASLFAGGSLADVHGLFSLGECSGGALGLSSFGGSIVQWVF